MMTFTQILMIALVGFGPGPAPSEEYELYKTGRKAWIKNNWSEAAEAFAKLVEDYPKSPRRCRSQNYLGYCYRKMGKDREAFEVYSKLIEHGDCNRDTLIDAKSERLRLAKDLVGQDPSMLKILKDGLNDEERTIRMLDAILLSELDDASGLEVFFETMENETDQDLLDTATQHILKLGSAKDKQRLQKILDRHKEANKDKKPKMIRVIIRDLETNSESTKVNVPIGLINHVLNMFDEEQRKLIKEESGIDLDTMDFNLEDLPAGTVLFKVIDGKKTEIKVFLE